jgi:hypothetical protein
VLSGANTSGRVSKGLSCKCLFVIQVFNSELKLTSFLLLQFATLSDMGLMELGVEEGQ